MDPKNKLDLDRTTWSGTIRLGLGFGLITALAIFVAITARDALRGKPALELAVNTTINLIPLLAAAVGAYIAPIRKMIVGTVCGLLSILPSLLIALLLLSYIAPLIIVPMVLSLMVPSVYTVIGAAIGSLLSQVIIAQR